MTESALRSLPCLKLEFDGGVTLTVPPTNYYQYQPGGSSCLQLLITDGGGSINIVGQVCHRSALWPAV